MTNKVRFYLSNGAQVEQDLPDSFDWSHFCTHIVAQKFFCNAHVFVPYEKIACIILNPTEVGKDAIPKDDGRALQ